MNNYKPQDFAEMLGVSVKTLQRWDREGKLKAFRTPSDRRYYTHKQYVDYMSESKPEGKTIKIYYQSQCEKNVIVKFCKENQLEYIEGGELLCEPTEQK